ncbi:hypothetical protein ACEQ8H_003031 [Pleosporales sp. CAS-2024a]
MKANLLIPLLAASAVRSQVVPNSTYDYIVVGGGTSGLTVADRLTENGEYSVLVLEYNHLNDNPALLLPSDVLAVDPSRYYNITSLPNAGLLNATRKVQVGALVGGGSGVNGMFFDRGSKSDYDAWETLGNKGWNFASLLPYFKKSVTFTPPSAQVQDKYNYTYDVQEAYGGHGQVHVSFPPYQFPGMDYVWNAWNELGVKKPKEAAAGDAIGPLQAPSALDPVTRTRSYARTAHYDPFVNRSNYLLETGYRVTEVILDNGTAGLGAVGVNVMQRGGNGQKMAVKARKEVIVAAGAVWTPWLLQRSGIGPAAILEQAGIEVKKNLPGVGANFQDHPYGGPVWNWTTNAPEPQQGDLLSNATLYAEAKKEYDASRTGSLTVARGNQAAFLPLKVVAPEKWQGLVDAVAAQDPTPYLPSTYEPTVIAGYKAQQKLTAELLARDDSAAYEILFGAGPIGSGVLERPLSRGTININTTHPLSDPVVDYRTFSNPLDMALAIPIVHFSRRFNRLNAFASLAPVEVAPGTNVTSDADIAAFLRATFAPTLAHPASTASMLAEELGGVVDTELRVHGVKGLSVVDASIIPYLPATHLCTTVYAVAERAADLIKARTEW